MKKQRTGIIVMTAALLACSAFAADPDGQAEAETPEERDARMQWWRDAKFGMFIHWGVYSRMGGMYKGRTWSRGRIHHREWVQWCARIPLAEYREIASEFNPVKFDAEKWVKAAKNGGAKYIVITARHHDGFALWPSAVSDFNLRDVTPFKRDPLKELADAARKHGVRLGFYYSHGQDWYHPGGAIRGNQTWDDAQKGDNDTFHREISLPQQRELLTHYGPGIPAIIWYDSAGDVKGEWPQRYVDQCYELQPGIVLNNRSGDRTLGDHLTYEGMAPSKRMLDRDWESCQRLDGTWGYHAARPDLTEEQVRYDVQKQSRKLLDIVVKGGNYLLNVGPTGEGEIRQDEIDRFAGIGAWLRVAGDAVYGTKPGPYYNGGANGYPVLSWGACTAKGNTVYLHLLTPMPLRIDSTDGRYMRHLAGLGTGAFGWFGYPLRLPVLPGRNVVKASVLGHPGVPVEVAVDGDTMTVTVPDAPSDPVGIAVALELDGNTADLPAMEMTEYEIELMRSWALADKQPCATGDFAAMGVVAASRVLKDDAAREFLEAAKARCPSQPAREYAAQRLERLKPAPSKPRIKVPLPAIDGLDDLGL